MLSILSISSLALAYLILFVLNPAIGIAFITAFRTLFLMLNVRIGAYAYSGEGFLTLMLIITCGTYLLFRGIKGVPKSVVYAFLGFILYCLLTIIVAEDVANFLKKELRLIGYFVLYLAVFKLSQENRNKSILLWSFFIAIIVTTIPAIYIFSLNPEQYTALQNKPDLGGIMKKNNFGFFSCYMILFLLYFRNTSKNKLVNLLVLFLLITQFFVFVLSFTRAAWVSFVGAFLVIFLMSKNKKKFILPIVGMIFLAGILAPVIHYGLVGDITQKREYGMSSIQWRLEYAWPASIKAFKQKPLMGWGLGNDLRALTEAAGLKKTSHNDYLLVLVETGLIGLFLYLVLLSTIAIKSFKGFLMTKDDDTRELLLSSLGILTAYLIGSLAEHLLQTPGATGYVITFIALTHGFYHSGNSLISSEPKTAKIL